MCTVISNSENCLIFKSVVIDLWTAEAVSICSIYDFIIVPKEFNGFLVTSIKCTMDTLRLRVDLGKFGGKKKIYESYFFFSVWFRENHKGKKYGGKLGGKIIRNKS